MPGESVTARQNAVYSLSIETVRLPPVFELCAGCSLDGPDVAYGLYLAFGLVMSAAMRPAADRLRGEGAY